MIALFEKFILDCTAQQKRGQENIETNYSEGLVSLQGGGSFQP